MSEKQEVSPRRRRRTAAEVEQIKTEFASSGLKQREFCRSRGLSLSTLQRYLKNPQRRRKATPAKPRLLPVEVVHDPGIERATDCGLAVVLAGGRKIEVRSDFDEAVFQRLFHLLERM